MKKEKEIVVKQNETFFEFTIKFENGVKKIPYGFIKVIKGEMNGFETKTTMSSKSGVVDKEIRNLIKTAKDITDIINKINLSRQKI